MQIITNRTKLDGTKHLAKSSRVRTRQDGTTELQIYYAGEDGKGYAHILSLILTQNEATTIGSGLLASSIRTQSGDTDNDNHHKTVSVVRAS